MDLGNIRIEAQRHIGVTIESPLARRYANECLTHLCNMFPRTVMTRKRGTLENVVVDKETPLPLDCYMLDKVKLRGELYQDYELFGTDIVFQNSGNFNIEYFKRPTPLTAETDVPGIPEPFFPSIAVFVGARESFRLFGEEDFNSIRLIREFTEMSTLANDLMTQHGRRRIIKPRGWW